MTLAFTKLKETKNCIIKILFSQTKLLICISNSKVICIAHAFLFVGVKYLGEQSPGV